MRYTLRPERTRSRWPALLATLPGIALVGLGALASLWSAVGSSVGLAAGGLAVLAAGAALLALGMLAFEVEAPVDIRIRPQSLEIGDTRIALDAVRAVSGTERRVVIVTDAGTWRFETPPQCSPVPAEPALTHALGRGPGGDGAPAVAQARGSLRIEPYSSVADGVGSTRSSTWLSPA